MPSKTVLIMDRDLGFVFWLGQILDSAGYQALPAKSSVDAIALQNELHLEIDLLILNPSLEGGCEFAETVRRSQEHLKIMAALDEQEDPNTAVMADASRHKPSVRDRVSKLEWLAVIEQVFATHRTCQALQCSPGKGTTGLEGGYSFPGPGYFAIPALRHRREIF